MKPRFAWLWGLLRIVVFFKQANGDQWIISLLNKFIPQSSLSVSVKDMSCMTSKCFLRLYLFLLYGRCIFTAKFLSFKFSSRSATELFVKKWMDDVTVIFAILILLTSFLPLRKQNHFRLELNLYNSKERCSEIHLISRWRVTHIKEQTNYFNASLNTNPSWMSFYNSLCSPEGLTVQGLILIRHLPSMLTSINLWTPRYPFGTSYIAFRWWVHWIAIFL